MTDKKVKVVTYRTSEKGLVGVRIGRGGPAVRVGKRVVWARTDEKRK
jgi:hypothetical protein